MCCIQKHSTRFTHFDLTGAHHLIASLERIYCDKIGTEFMHIQNPRVRNWIREKIENRPAESEVPQELLQKRETAKVQ